MDKKIAFFLFFATILYSCKKNLIDTDTSKQPDPVIVDIKKYLKKEINESELNFLDWSKVAIYRNNNKQIQAVGIPDQANEKTIILFKKESSWYGNWVQIKKISDSSSKIVRTSFDSIYEITVEIKNNQINNIVYKKNNQIDISPRPNITFYQLPASILMTDTYYYLTTILGNTGASNGTDFEYLEPPSDGGSDLITLELDNSLSEPGVDIKKLFKCFDNIPNIGAKFSITLCADLPINQVPDAPYSVTGSPGHTFIIVTKENNGQKVTQVMGLYPNGTRKLDALTSAPSKIVNDKYHQINSSITMNDIGVDNFNIIRANAEDVFSKRQYDLSAYNCANFALDVFNVIRPTSPIVIEPFYTNVSPTGTPAVMMYIQKSPQMLFKKLQSMKNNNHSESSSITIDQSNNNKAPITNGECN